MSRGFSAAGTASYPAQKINCDKETGDFSEMNEPQFPWI
jgi:hypothetical protein